MEGGSLELELLGKECVLGWGWVGGLWKLRVYWCTRYVYGQEAWRSRETRASTNDPLQDVGKGYNKRSQSRLNHDQSNKEGPWWDRMRWWDWRSRSRPRMPASAPVALHLRSPL